MLAGYAQEDKDLGGDREMSEMSRSKAVETLYDDYGRSQDDFDTVDGTRPWASALIKPAMNRRHPSPSLPTRGV